MAIAFVANRGNSNVTSAVGNNSLPILNPASITPANTLFLIVNARTGAALLPAVACGASVTDIRGNLWVAETCQDSNDGVNGHGGQLLVYRCLVTSPYLAGDVLTLQGALAGFLVEFQIHEFSGVSYGPHALYTAANFGVNTTTAAALLVSVSAAGQLVLAVGSVGSDNTVVTDTDVLDGTWSTAFRRTPGAVNFQLWESHKILTGFTSATQTYNATWTSSGGDNNYAQMLLVYDPSAPGGGSLTQQFPPQDNPNYSCPDSGFEPLPTSTAKVPVDTGSAYQIEHKLPTYSFGTHFYSAVAQYDDTETAMQQHHIAYDLYQTGSEVPQDTVTTLTFPIGRINTLTAGVKIFNSAGTLVETGPVVNSANALRALQTAGDYYVRYDTSVPGASIQCQFDLTNGANNLANYANSRIVRVGVRFAGWKDDSSTLGIPVGEGLDVVYQPFIGPASYEVEMGAWLLPDYKRSAVQQLRWFGETNPLPKIANSSSYYGGGVGNGLWFRTFPDGSTTWSYQDIANFNGNFTTGIGSDVVKIYGLPGADFSQTLVYLDFIELVVEVAPERRLGNAVQTVSTSPIYATAPLPASSYSPGRAALITLRNVIDQSAPLTVSGSPNDYTLVAREALPSSTSDYWTALANAPGAPAVGGVIPTSFAGLQIYSPGEALGPSLCFNGYTQPRTMTPNQRPLAQRVVTDGVFASAAKALEQYTLSFGAGDAGNYLSTGSFFPVFHGMAPIGAQQVYTAHSQTQRFYDGAGSTYDRIKVICRPDPLTVANLIITTAPDGSTTTITPAVARAGTDIGFGWFEVTVPMTASVVGTGVVQTMTFASSTASSAPWFVSSVQSVGPNIGQAFEPFAQNSGSAVNSYAAVMECALASPVVTLGTSTISMDPVDKAICRASTYDVPTINTSNSSSFDRLIVERSLDVGATWKVAFRVVDPTANLTLIDEECPWDVGGTTGAITVRYRVTGYRDSDRRSSTATTAAWTGTSVAPGAAFGLSSNVAGYSVAYVPGDPNQVQVTWNPLNPVTMIPLHGVDYQYALRVPENRGLSVSVAVLVDAISYCCMPSAIQTLPAGFDSSIVHFDDSGVLFDGSTAPGTSICATAQTSSLLDYSELLQKGGASMSPRPYERDILNVFNSSAPWVLKLPGSHSRYVTVQVGAMAITPAAGVYMAELTLTDITPPSADPYNE